MAALQRGLPELPLRADAEFVGPGKQFVRVPHIPDESRRDGEAGHDYRQKKTPVEDHASEFPQ